MRPSVYEPITPVSHRSAPRASIVITVVRDDSDPAFWLTVPGIAPEWSRPNEGESAREAQERAFELRILPHIAKAITRTLFENGEVTLALEAR